MNTTVETGHNTGALPSPKDERDFVYGQDLGTASVPFDWSKGYDVEVEMGMRISPKDQGVSNSCGGQAWSYYDAVLNFISDKTYEERSAKFIFAQTHIGGGGSNGRDNCELCLKKGVSKESLCVSYDHGQPPANDFMIRAGDISQEAFDDAKTSKIGAYSQVPVDIDSLAQAARDNHGMVIGILGENNGTWRSAYPLPPKQRYGDYWAHWVFVGKAFLIGDKKYIGFINSWGNVGNAGWQFISEDYMPFIWETRAMTYLTAPTPTPMPVLKFSSHGDAVKTLQKALGTTIDGVFGAMTLLAVKTFQKAHNLTVDGVVGPKTWALLIN